MSLPEFKTDKPCFIDPVSGQVVSYAQFAANLVRLDSECDSGNTYGSLCRIVANIVRGIDFNLAQGEFSTTGDRETPATSAMPLRPLSENEGVPAWEAVVEAIRNSKSQIRLMTSGTTGIPKQVVHSIQSLTRGLRTGQHHRDDVWGLAYPLDHLAGLQVLFQALFNQNTLVQLFGQPTDEIHQAIETTGVTHLSCTPTFLKLLATGNQVHTTVRRLTTGGERFDAATRANVKRLFPHARHRNIYALTEVGNLLIADGDQFTVPADLHDFIAVIDGCLAIHRSLLADPTVESASHSIDSDSNASETISDSRSDWFSTGDIVDVLNENPLIFKFSTRHDDVINVGGYKVIPHQVEQHLLEISPIQHAVVYGKKNSVTGQIVVCDVVLVPGRQLDLVETRRWLAQVLPRYAVPRMINIVESLRMTPSGKLCRRSETS